MKLKLLITIAGLILTGCISLDIDYLDDNYSDRVELAQKLLGMDSVYFDTSSYNKTKALSVAIPVTEINSNRKLVGGGIHALVEQFELIAGSYREIAISGNLSNEVVRVLLASLSKIQSGTLSDVQILYIGDVKYQLEIQQAVEDKGAIFIFAKRPKTTI